MGLDPFGSNPLTALEAARSGYRILVASNNPILSFMLEILASAPPASEFEAAISVLGSSRRGEDRLERYLQSFYQTPCPSCGKQAQGIGYIWQRDQALPVKVRYRCLECGDTGERPFGELDQERLAAVGSDAMHAREHYPGCCRKVMMSSAVRWKKRSRLICQDPCMC